MVWHQKVLFELGMFLAFF